MTTKQFPAFGAALAFGFVALMLTPSVAARSAGAAKKIPVIYDSDIGDDIDDTWALAMLLHSPELDVKLVVGDYGKPQYRAKLFAKFLERVGRTDVAVGIGIGKGAGGRQRKWIEGYDLKKYPGTVHEDGVAAMIDLIMKSPEQITVVAVGPLPNIAEALKREPRIARKARFVGMHGSVRVGYGGSKKPAREWNVKADPKSCAAALSAPWDVTITPLDTCGRVVLSGDHYKAVYDSKNPTAVALLENYKIWNKGKPIDRKSSTLYDTVAVYLAFASDFTEIEELGIRVTKNGMTVIDPNARKIKVATRWKDMNAFKDLLVKRVTGQK